MNAKELKKYALLGLANGVFSVCVSLLYGVGEASLNCFWNASFSKEFFNTFIHMVRMIMIIILNFFLSEMLLIIVFLIIACSLFSITIKFLFGKRIKSEIIFWQIVGFCFIAGAIPISLYRVFYNMYQIKPNFDWAIFQEYLFYSGAFSHIPIALILIMISNLLFALSVNYFTKRRLR